MPSRPLSSTPALRRLPFGHFSESDTQNQALRKQILARDKNKCADCGLVFARHMEVRHLDDDHANLDEANLVCICPFCHLRDHLHPTGFANAGLIIASTHLNQALVNSIVIACWYIISRVPNKIDIRQLPEPGVEIDAAQQMLLSATDFLKDLHSRGLRWAGAYNALVSEPDALGEVLCDLSTKDPETYAKRGELTQHLHILPAQDVFEIQCADWFAEFDRTRPLSAWSKGLEALMGRMDTNFKDFRDSVHQKQRAELRSQTDSLGRPVGSNGSTMEALPASPSSNDGDDTSGGGRLKIGSRYSD